MTIKRNFVGKLLNQDDIYISQESIRATSLASICQTFSSSPLAFERDMTAAVGTTGGENLLFFGDGHTMEQHMLGTQTIIIPTLSGTGMNLSLDQTDDDGAEYGFGITAASKAARTIGTDKFYVRFKVSIADVSGTDAFHIGFRNVEAYQATITDYIDYATLNVNAGNIYTYTDLNNGGTPTATDTTEDWADGETHTIGVYVDIDGSVTYELNGEEIENTASFTFDDGDVVVPFFYFLHSSDVAGAIVAERMEVGLW